MSGKVGSNTGPRMKARRLVCGVGSNSVPDVVRSPIYTMWANMLRRCYKPASDEKSYVSALVCEEWLEFANFKAWAEVRYKPGYHLDKDLTSPGSKVYSPDTCAFVPQKVNNAARNNGKKTRFLPGVKMAKGGRIRPYMASLANECLGYFHSIAEAHKKWQVKKAEAIEAIVDEYAAGEHEPRVVKTLKSIADGLRMDAARSVPTLNVM